MQQHRRPFGRDARDLAVPGVAQGAPCPCLVDVRLLEEAQAELQQQHAPDRLVEELLVHLAGANSVRQRRERARAGRRDAVSRKACPERHLHVETRAKSSRRRIVVVTRETMRGEVNHGACVAHDEPVEAELAA